MQFSEEIASWIKEQVEKADKKGIVFGLSGGIDSAAVAVLCKKALGDNVLALILPCKSNPQDEGFALRAAKNFDIRTEKVVLDDVFDKLAGIFSETINMAKANLKPRLRMCTLYYFANTLDYLVAGTGNKSELAVGYFTKYGDGGADILPLGGLLKTEVRDLARDLGIPDEIINRVPSAGLWDGQTDEGEMGITYDELDEAIKAIEKGQTGDIDENVMSKVKKMMKDSEHKRAEIPVFYKGSVKS